MCYVILLVCVLICYGVVAWICKAKFDVRWWEIPIVIIAFIGILILFIGNRNKKEDRYEGW